MHSSILYFYTTMVWTLRIILLLLFLNLITLWGRYHEPILQPHVLNISIKLLPCPSDNISAHWLFSVQGTIMKAHFPRYIFPTFSWFPSYGWDTVHPVQWVTLALKNKRTALWDLINVLQYDLGMPHQGRRAQSDRLYHQQDLHTLGMMCRLWVSDSTFTAASVLINFRPKEHFKG